MYKNGYNRRNRQGIIEHYIKNEKKSIKIIPEKNSPKRASYNMAIQRTRVQNEIDEFEKNGYRVINITEIRPDFIAVKDGKIIGVEVEYGYARVHKYSSELRAKYDDIIWLKRGKRYGK